MAVVLGNLALLIDATSLPFSVPDRKPRPPPALDVLLSLSKREPHANSSLTSVGGAAPTKGFESESESWFSSHKVAARGKSSFSKVDGVGFDSGSSEEESNGNGNGNEVEEGGGGELDWEKQMRKRVKEIEEMRELEKKAEELQSRGEADEDGGGEGKDETEEEKRMRVRKELEKV